MLYKNHFNVLNVLSLRDVYKGCTSVLFLTIFISTTEVLISQNCYELSYFLHVKKSKCFFFDLIFSILTDLNIVLKIKLLLKI